MSAPTLFDPQPITMNEAVAAVQAGLPKRLELVSKRLAKFPRAEDVALVRQRVATDLKVAQTENPLAALVLVEMLRTVDIELSRRHRKTA